MKRLAQLGLSLLIGWSVAVSVVGAQSATQGPLTPESALFQDALLLARAIPFLAALGIVMGILQARATAKRGSPVVGQEVIRHDRGTTMAHWLNALGFFIGFGTGAVLLKWVAAPIDLRTTFALHYIGSGLIIYAVFNHLSQHIISGGYGLIPKRLSVIRDVVTETLEYAGVFGPERAVFRINWPKAIRQPIARYLRALGLKKPAVDKYVANEQLLSYTVWAVLTILIVGTGLIKALRYVYEMPTPFIGTMTMIHDATAIAIGVMIIIHLLPLTLVPANWPMLKSMFTTKVSLKHVQEHHPLWYQRLMNPRRATAATPATKLQDAGQVAGAKGGD